jgi:endoglucanase
VKFLGFTGRLVKPAETELRWRIAVPAEGADYFEVQWGTDGRQWEVAGMEKIRSSLQADYLFRHSHAAQSELFYRLKQYDRDGQFVYSPVIRLTQQGLTAIRVYPNPASETLQILLPEWQLNTTIRLIDMTGRVIMVKRANHQLEWFHVGHLAPGIYQVRIDAGSKSYVERVIIKR